MKVEIAIGETHRFELREALLIYRDNQRSFITRHEIAARKDGPPSTATRTEHMKTSVRAAVEEMFQGRASVSHRGSTVDKSPMLS